MLLIPSFPTSLVSIPRLPALESSLSHSLGCIHYRFMENVPVAERIGILAAEEVQGVLPLHWFQSKRILKLFRNERGAQRECASLL